MRLSKIRIAGFKSFVDPVTIDLRSPLVGILGPNGCGKSNTIDAVRWVMGESSAKNLRGQSMEDVIFNGSSSRKPVGQASVELIFDNSDASLGGEFAQFSEISIKRQATREGKSTYFLNGTRCRRRDITDIFLGTGLGPRSYAIIEQGMISRLIEAKPEELRNTLEEAAGISRYKERRKETETRIRHTRENLERLEDVRDEVEKQLKRLDKQAKVAEKFTTLREQERAYEAQHLYLQWQALEQQKQQDLEGLQQCAERYKEELSQVQNQEQQVNALREQVSQANAQLNQIQGQYYQAGSEIARLEQSIQHQQELQQRQQDSFAQLEQSIEESKQHELEDQMVLEEAHESLLTLEPEGELLQTAQEQAQAQLQLAEQVQGDWQGQWESLQADIEQPTQTAQIEKARIEQLERQKQQLTQRLERLQQEEKSLSEQTELEDIEQWQEELLITQARLEDIQLTSDDLQQALPKQQQALQEQQALLSQKQSEYQQLQGRLSSLETLQQAALQDNPEQQAWLKQQGWQDNERLAQVLQVETGWEQAIEHILQYELDAIVVDTLPQKDLPADTHLMLAQANVTGVTQSNLQPLSDKVLAPHSLKERLAHVYCATHVEEAFALQVQLKVGESLLCQDGTWLGKTWLMTPSQQQQEESVLKRAQALAELHVQLPALAEEIAALQQTIEQLKSELAAAQEQNKQYQQQANQLHRQETSLLSQINTLQQKSEQLQQRKARIQTDQAEITQFLEQHEEELIQATEQRNEALMQLENLLAQKAQLESLKHGQQQDLAQLKQNQQQAQEALQQHKLQLETARQQQASSQRQLERVKQRLQQLEQQKQTLQTQIESQTNPQQAFEEDLLIARETQAEIGLQLSDAREQVQQLEQQIRQADEQRLHYEQVANKTRDQQEQQKLMWQTVSVKAQNLQEQLEATEFELEALQASLEQGQLAEELEQALIDTKLAISKLGAINLAAIDEFKEHQERKQYLDQQNDDLVEALETLEKAMRKIDRETRARFKETFETVNQRLQSMFPSLFGGGECYLEMTENDLLTAGVTIMARPPGKRLSSIHLMSGGEKALTAVALVFAIFELNPAPFCMLDEVDAPLDEANVGRFCDLVRQMSESVQFIFITHNRATMELAENLIGVTMREAGVSRLVSVDIAEATQFANG